MIGNKSTIRVVAYVFALCFLLTACSGKTDSNEDDWVDHETVSNTVTDLTGITGTTSVITDKEETQSGTALTGSTIQDDEFTTGDHVSGTESSDKPTGGTTVTIPVNGNDGTSATESSSNPAVNTNTTLEAEENDMPDYGIELPDDNWD